MSTGTSNRFTARNSIGPGSKVPLLTSGSGVDSGSESAAAAPSSFDSVAGADVGDSVTGDSAASSLSEPPPHAVAASANASSTAMTARIVFILHPTNSFEELCSGTM